jgi:hypothetical protein
LAENGFFANDLAVRRALEAAGVAWCSSTRTMMPGRAAAQTATEKRLPDLQEQLTRLPHQFAGALIFRNGLASITAMLERVLIASRGA